MTDVPYDRDRPPEADIPEDAGRQEQEQAVAEHAGDLAVDRTTEEARELEDRTEATRASKDAVAVEPVARSDEQTQRVISEQTGRAGRQQAAEAAGRFATRRVAPEPRAEDREEPEPEPGARPKADEQRHEGDEDQSTGADANSSGNGRGPVDGTAATSNDDEGDPDDHDEHHEETSEDVDDTAEKRKPDKEEPEADGERREDDDETEREPRPENAESADEAEDLDRHDEDGDEDGPEDREEEVEDAEPPSHPNARDILYGPDGLARSSEAISPDDINRIYDETRPQAQNSVAAITHDASRLLDLALSEQSGDVDTRLELLDQAHDRYLKSLYNVGEDDQGNPVYEPKTGKDGKDEPIVNNHSAQARSALDQWDLYRARIENRDLTEEERTRIYLNSAATLDSMRSAAQRIFEAAPASPKSSEERRAYDRQRSATGMFNESLAMALMSRQQTSEDTFLATPTSEVRRSEGGPDASVPLTNQREVYVDWKSNKSKGVDVVAVGSVIFHALGEGTQDAQPTAIQSRDASLYVAELLVRESQGDTLNTLEKSYLDTAQRGLCDAIDLNSRAMGVEDVRAEARYR